VAAGSQGRIRGTLIIHAQDEARVASRLCVGGVQKIPGDGDFRAETFGGANRRALDLLHQAGEIIARAGDGGDAEGRRLPGRRFAHFGDRDVETVRQPLLQAADDLPAILEGVGVLDAKLKEHGGDGHRRFILPGNVTCTPILPPIPGTSQLPAGEGVHY